MRKSLTDVQRRIDEELTAELRRIEEQAEAAKQAVRVRAADSMRLAKWILADEDGKGEKNNGRDSSESERLRAAAPIISADATSNPHPSAHKAAEMAAKALRENFTLTQVRAWADEKWPGIVAAQKRKNIWSDAMHTLSHQKGLIEIAEKRPSNVGSLYRWIGPA